MTTTEETTMPELSELDAYKAQVREEAFRVAAQQSWCDDGLNQTLTKLGLPPKVEYVTFVQVPIVQTIRITNNSAQSQEEADAAALNPEKLADHVNSRFRINGDATVYVHDGSHYKQRDPDPSNHGDTRNQCRRENRQGYSCTLHRETVDRAAGGNMKVPHHVIEDGMIQHLWGNGDTVGGVWTESLREIPLGTIERHGMMTPEAREAEQVRRDEAAKATTTTILAS